MKENKRLDHTHAPPRKDNLEATMQLVSRIVSFLGLGLMIAGFASMSFGSVSIAPPGDSALSLLKLTSFASRSPGMISMSAGIILLAILPGIRVILALVEYARQRNLLNSVVALIILVELIISIRAG